MRAWLFLALCATQALAAPAGSPGTPTPQPYAQPQLQPLPANKIENRPLLIMPKAAERPVRDQPLPSPEREAERSGKIPRTPQG